MPQLLRHQRDVLGALCERAAGTAPDRVAAFSGDEVAGWPAGWIDVAVKSRLLKKHRRTVVVECRGCSRRCSRPVEEAPKANGLRRFLVTCDLRDDVSCLLVPSKRLARWHTSRQQFIDFVARELNLSPPTFNDETRPIQLGTLKGHGARRAVSIEFAETVWLLVGDARLDLRDLMKLDGQDIHLDRDELQILAQHSADEQTGGKRYQPSRNKQRYLVELTKLRNVRMQEMADQLKRANPSWKKNAIAQAIIESGECANIKNSATVERIIRVARNLRRKNFA